MEALFVIVAFLFGFAVRQIGSGACDHLRERYGKSVNGVDFDAERVTHHQEQGRQVVC